MRCNLSDRNSNACVQRACGQAHVGGGDGGARRFLALELNEGEGRLVLLRLQAMSCVSQHLSHKPALYGLHLEGNTVGSRAVTLLLHTGKKMLSHHPDIRTTNAVRLMQYGFAKQSCGGLSDANVSLLP